MCRSLFIVAAAALWTWALIVYHWLDGSLYTAMLASEGEQMRYRALAQKRWPIVEGACTLTTYLPSVRRVEVIRVMRNDNGDTAAKQRG